MQIIEKIFIGFFISSIIPTISYAQIKYEKAILAGGCFWCMTEPFEKLDGVISVVSGYTGGKGKNPGYENYAAKGHTEAVEVTYDPSKITYQEILDVFWKQIDPTDADGQFCDKGQQYRTVIFYQNNEQKQAARGSKEVLDKSGRYSKPLVTAIIKATQFYKAEDYHQDYNKKNPKNYQSYRFSCGRDQYLEKTWGGSMNKKEDLKKKLTPTQYKVTQENGTEEAFYNQYWDNHKEGIYVDIVSGEVLFSSLDKFESGTGWPSFTKPLEPDSVIEESDKSLLMKRTEARSKKGNSHLGHVFDDGPAPLGLRYCMNSAALRFIPKEDLEKEGYVKYKNLFEKKEN